MAGKADMTVQDLVGMPVLRTTATATSSHLSGLRTVVHIDMDAFYAQCEMRRLNVPDDQPLAVRQWRGLVAVNYPARKFGIKRHASAAEARQLCPNIILQHVPTWVVNRRDTAEAGGSDRDRLDRTTWAYRDDAAQNMSSQKVSLDPYRRESRKILATLKQELDAISAELEPSRAMGDGPMFLFEKASVDEVYLDISGLVHVELLVRFPELKRFGDDHADEPNKPLPTVRDVELDWGDRDNLAIINPDYAPDDHQDCDRAPDGPFMPDGWDDVTIHIGHQITRRLRQALRDRLGYTSSAGVASNKMLAKLGSGHLKPGGQTVIRPSASTAFLRPLKFTSIRNLGGKLGDRLVAILGTDKIGDLIDLPVSTIRRRLDGHGSADMLKAVVADNSDDDDVLARGNLPSGPTGPLDQTASWLHGLLSGTDRSAVRIRPGAKSILSAKAFNPALPSISLARAWLRVFIADIHTRCVDEGMVDEQTLWWARSGRRPKTMTVHIRQGSGSAPGPYSANASPSAGPLRSKSGPITYPSSPALLGSGPARALLFETACKYVAQLVVEGSVWPCAYLSVGLFGFESSCANGTTLTDFFRPKDGNPGPVPALVSKRIDDRDGGRDEEVPVDLSTATTHQLTGYAPDESTTRVLLPGEQVPPSTMTMIPSKTKQRAIVNASKRKQNKQSIKSMFGAAAARTTNPQPTDEPGGEKSVYFEHEPTCPPAASEQTSPDPTNQDPTSGMNKCVRCNVDLDQIDVNEHDDWHYAQDLSNEINHPSTESPTRSSPTIPPNPIPTRRPFFKTHPATTTTTIATTTATTTTETATPTTTGLKKRKAPGSAADTKQAKLTWRSEK